MSTIEPDIADRTRARLADAIDRQMNPIGRTLIERLALGAGQTVLDIGCGAGATVVQLAECVGSGGCVVGGDLGPAVLAVARERTRALRHVTLLQAEAAPLDRSAASFDLLYSRFGTMFFDQPVAALDHLRQLLRPAGTLRFVCWRPMRDNPLDRIPALAAGITVPHDAPAFTMSDPDRIQAILLNAGYRDIRINALDTPVSCGNVEDTLSVVLHVGALGKQLRDTPSLRKIVADRVRDTLRHHTTRQGQVVLTAATWAVTARR